MRAPEEYNYKVETQKVDIYSLGNIFYAILTGENVFKNEDSDDVKNIVKEGGRPHIEESMRLSTDRVDMALIKAMQMCHIQDPEKRATADQLKIFLAAELVNLE